MTVYRALKGFTGKIVMKKGEIRDFDVKSRDQKQIVKNLSKAGYIAKIENFEEVNIGEA